MDTTNSRHSPVIFSGDVFQDHRGTITYNNSFDATAVKRIYTIENISTELVRGWQGHQIEQRWFAALTGRFLISVVVIDDFTAPASALPIHQFKLSAEALSYLHIPAGCVTAIQALVEGSKLLVLADYKLGETKDECRYPIDYFSNFSVTNPA